MTKSLTEIFPAVLEALICSRSLSMASTCAAHRGIHERESPLFNTASHLELSSTLNYHSLLPGTLQSDNSVGWSALIQAGVGRSHGGSGSVECPHRMPQPRQRGPIAWWPSQWMGQGEPLGQRKWEKPAAKVQNTQERYKSGAKCILLVLSDSHPM